MFCYCKHYLLNGEEKNDRILTLGPVRTARAVHTHTPIEELINRE